MVGLHPEWHAMREVPGCDIVLILCSKATRHFLGRHLGSVSLLDTVMQAVGYAQLLATELA